MARRTAALLIAAIAVDGCAAAREREVRAANTVYLRTDSDATPVISPTVSASGQATEQTTLSASYTVDARTGASVDVVTAATKAITRLNPMIFCANVLYFMQTAPYDKRA